MSGKGVKSIKDEKQELQKQIGCITGFFKLFYRQRLITGQRTDRYIQNASSSGVTNNGIKEQNSAMQKPKTKNQKIAREKQQFSTESSKTSVSSSSCSSSISSHEFNRIIKIESLSSNKQIQVPKNPHSKVSTKQHHAQNQQSLDFYDIIKDSMHREGKGLYVKTLTKQEKRGHGYALNQHIDSPRPIIVSKEPLHTLSKSKKAHWDSPRLSYDALKSTTRYKELPRLSLDSKQGSIRGIDGGNKARNVSNGSQRGYERNSSTMLNQIQEPETSKRSSSVVAKLMGLEALSDSTQTCRTSSCSTDKKEIVARTSTCDEYKKQQSSASPRNRRVDDSITNVNPNSRFALESSPWRQPDARQNSLSQDSSKGSDSDIKESKPSLSVYGEIEKRLAELEFKKSGKDLRALKQILEAMKRFTDSSPDTRNTNTSLSESFEVQSPRIQQKDSPSATVAVEMSNSIKGSKLPIIITKPTKETKTVNSPPKKLSIHDKSCIGKSSPTNGRLVDKQKSCSKTKNTKEPFGQQVPSADKNNYFRTSKLMQSSKSPQDSNGKNTTTSPRRPKKFGVERCSPPTSPSSDFVINRRQHNEQLVELSTSSSSTSTQSFSILQEKNEHFSQMNSHGRKFKHHVNVISSDFGSNRSLATQSDIEEIRLDQSNTFEESRKENSKAAIVVTTEQPSPVSVLDAAFYKEDPPSPVKTKSNVSKNLGEALSTDDDSEENSMAQILQEIDWTDEKLINVNNIKNPDHKYISEILIASGLVSDRNSNQILHSSGHLINPKLFFALEQMKTNKSHFNIEDNVKKISRAIISPENVKRKLIFDVVNDILVKKLMYESSSSLCFLPNGLKGKQFFEEICTEIDELQPEKRNVSFVHEDGNLISLLCRDLKDHNTIWTNCCSEIPNMVLDIERLIFKDLITEVCEDELQNNFGGHCRKMLFPK